MRLANANANAIIITIICELHDVCDYLFTKFNAYRLRMYEYVHSWIELKGIYAMMPVNPLLTITQWQVTHLPSF